MKRVMYWYSSEQIDTGSPRALLGMVEALDRQRFKPYYLSSGDGRLTDSLRARGVEILGGTASSLDLGASRRSVASVVRLVRLIRENAIDIVHINEFGWSLDLALAAKLTGCKLVLHLHNPDPIHRRNLNRFLADTVVLVSKSQEGTVDGIDLVRKKLAVVHNAIDLEDFASGRRDRSTLDLRADQVAVVTVAQVCKRKGIDTVLEVAARVVMVDPRAVFLIVGPDGKGEEDFARAVKKRALEPGLRGHVRFIGPRSDIPTVLASSDVFLLPTRAEPFGIVVIEAMAAGVPLVASRVGGIPEIVRSDDEGVLVEPEDADGFAAAVLRYVRNPETRDLTAARAKASLSGRFDRGTLTANLSRLYA